MKQKYSNYDVLSPGTVIISAAGQCSDVKNIIKPIATAKGGEIFYVDFSQDEFYLGGSSFAQSQECIGNDTPGLQMLFILKGHLILYKITSKLAKFQQATILDQEV